LTDTPLDPLAVPAEAPIEPEPVSRSRLRTFISSVAKGVTVFALGFMLVVGALVAFLDTGPGHRLIVDRIAAMTPNSGLRIRIGRIEGSIWGRTQLKDVRLYDPDGLFAESSELRMDWRPISFLFNRLVINDLESDLVILHRLPHFIEPERPGPVLPQYDIHVGRLNVRQLRVDARITGRERTGSLQGEAEIRRGRALVRVLAEIRDPGPGAGAGGGDRLLMHIDAEPDRDRFDLEARVRAPANSVIGAMLGTRRPVRLDLGGHGGWARWAGSAQLDISAPAGRRRRPFCTASCSG
jgi:translocation and assembly module TamB